MINGLVAVVACAGLVLPQVCDAAEQDLGRLFMTPEARRALERQRPSNVQEAPSLESSTLRLNGVVTRSSGKSTVWVNDRPQHEDARDSGVSANLSRRQPDRATLSSGNESSADLRVGATLDRATRETSGGLVSGEIRVHRAATGK